MSTFENPETPELKLLAEWNRGFKERNLDLLAEPLHKDFLRHTYPRSLGKPVQTKEEWLENFGKVINFSTEFEVSYAGCRLELPSSWLTPSAAEPTFRHRSSREGRPSRPCPNSSRLISYPLTVIRFPIGHQRGQEPTRGENPPRVDLHSSLHRRRWKPEDQANRGVYRLQGLFGGCQGLRGSESQVECFSVCRLMTKDERGTRSSTFSLR